LNNYCKVNINTIEPATVPTLDQGTEVNIYWWCMSWQ